MKPMQSFPDVSAKVVLGIAAHPDDLDFGAGGTLAAFSKAGAAVHYLQITDGCKGTNKHISCEELTEIREREQLAACDIIGGKSVRFLHYCDGELEVTMKLKGEIVKVIRELKPDVVITSDPAELYAPSIGLINHSDHRAAGQAALDAVYPLARDHLSYPEQLGNGLQTHNVTTVLLLNFENHNYYSDISSTLSTKLDAVKAHASQVKDYDAFCKQLTDFATENGEKANCQFAEGFLRIDITQ